MPTPLILSNNIRIFLSSRVDPTGSGLQLKAFFNRFLCSVWSPDPQQQNSMNSKALAGGNSLSRQIIRQFIPAKPALLNVKAELALSLQLASFSF